MRINNKGFAITAVLYGILILFVFCVGSYLLVLSAKKDRVEDIVDQIEDEYNGRVTLVEHIKELYNNADKIVVKNNGIEYNYASSVSLMNDRLGGSTSDYNVGNIRYYGDNPNNYIDIGDIYEKDYVKNNWSLFTTLEPSIIDSETCKEYFNCTNLFEQGIFTDINECEIEVIDAMNRYGYNSVEEGCGTTIIAKKGTASLYRIIGVFKDVELSDGTKKDLVKVISPYSIGNYMWDSSSGDINYGNGINEWSQADLMKLLNPGYDSNKDFDYSGSSVLVNNSLWWNNASGICYVSFKNQTQPCDFTSNGLSDLAKEKIESVVWNTGGVYTNTLFANQLYIHERLDNIIENPSDGVTRTTKWTGQIALMYPSDHGYAADFNFCDESINYYDVENCYNNNWLIHSPSTTLFNSECTLTPGSNSLFETVEVAFIYDNNINTYTMARMSSNVRPVFYLDSELITLSGDGTINAPYKVRFK